MVTVIGFVFLWLQLRAVGRTISSDTHSKLYSEDNDLLKLLVNKPQLRPYIYDNCEVKPEDEGIAASLAELYCCHFEHVMLQLDNLPAVVQQSWVDYVRYLYSRSPAIRACYEEMKKDGVFVPEMERLLNEDCNSEKHAGVGWK